MMRSHVFGVLVGLFVFTRLAQSQTSAFYFTSSPRAWIGMGQTQFYSPTNGYTFAATIYPGELGAVEFWCMLSNRAVWWVDFHTPYGVPMTNGIYLNVVDATGAGTSAGVAFYGEGRADNTLSGYFTIEEVNFRSNTVTSFAADFAQYDGTLVYAWNEGSVRYNSTVPIPQPVLFATNFNDNIVVDWPVYATDFRLYSSSGIGTTNSWLPTNPTINSNANGTLSAFLPVGYTNQLFRLSR